MRHRTLPTVVVGLLVVAAAAWAAAAAAPAARADSGGGTEVTKTFTIPAAATAILRWTFETPPATAVKAVFQISRDKTHWRTLKVVKVAKGTKRVRTTWEAGSRAEVRFFRFDTHDREVGPGQDPGEIAPASLREHGLAAPSARPRCRPRRRCHPCRATSAALLGHRQGRQRLDRGGVLASPAKRTRRCTAPAGAV